MIEEYATNVAKQMGVKLSKVSVEEGLGVHCSDAYLLGLDSGKKQVSTLVYRSDLDELKRRKCCDRLEVKIRGALSRLQVL